jgi:non-homologous end joining protein Ku
MPIVDIPIEQFTFSDGSMNARQYHAWLWAQVPKDVAGDKLQRVSKVIDALTMKFMLDGLDDPVPHAEVKGGLADLIDPKRKKRHLSARQKRNAAKNVTHY